MSFLVEIKSLFKTFSPSLPYALNAIDSSIPRGEIVGLVGPDGAGKTTLIRLIAGLLLPSQGSISVEGHDTVKDAEFVHYLTGYMPQRFGLYEDLTVMQNLILYADLRSVIGQEREERFHKLLKFTGLLRFTDRLAGALSGGMKQKLGLACALIRTPSLLLLDEPSVGVDPISRRELWQMVKELLSQGISVIWSTAYLDEAERCDTVLLLSEGKLLYRGKPGELTGKMQERVFKISNIAGKKRKLLGEALQDKNVMDGVIQGKDVRIVMKDKIPFSLNFDGFQKEKVEIKNVAPRFEDAFVDILGGVPERTSKLALKTPVVESKSEIVIETKELTKKFGAFTAADNITFNIKRGEIFGLLGPNGAGKSTTFKMMCGLLKPTAGRALINGIDFQMAPSQARSKIGYMAQKFSLYGSLSVQQNLEFFSGAYNLCGKDRKDAVMEMVDVFNLKQYLKIEAAALPLGYKQRLALACSTMHHPEIIFLDEPTSGVDPLTRREFWMHINGLVEKRVTVMVTTHFMDEAEYCDRIALIYRSKMICMGTPDELKMKVVGEENLNPTLEDAFIKLIEEYDRVNPI